MCQRTIKPTDDASQIADGIHRTGAAPTVEPSEHIQIVQNFSRHKAAGRSVPSSVKALKSTLPGTAKTNGGGRFRTDAETAATTATGQQFLQQYAEAHRLIEIAEYRSALELLARLMDGATPDQVVECQSLRGYLFLQKLEFDKTVAECSKALRQQPTDAQTYAWRAAARGEQNQWRLAFDDLALACQFGGQRQPEFEALVQTYAQTANEFFRQQVSTGQPSATLLFERGWMFHHLNKAEKAVRDFQQALRIAPLHPWASTGLAMLAMAPDVAAISLPNEAIDQLCEHGIDGDSECRRLALTLRARLSHLNNDVERAHACCQQALDLAGNDAVARLQCAQLQFDLGDRVAATETLTQLLDAHHRYADAWRLRGDCFYALRNDARAVEDFSECLRLQPDDPVALIRRATAESRRGHHDLAMDDLDLAIEQNENNFLAWLKRGEVAAAAGDLNEAMTVCQRAKEIDNRHAQVYALLGSVHQQMGDYGRAAEEYSRSVDYAKTPAEKAKNLFRRGIQWYELKEFEKATNDFTQSLEHRPDHAGTLIWRAAASSRNENLAAAIADLQEAIAVRPSSADQYRQLGQTIADRAVGFFTRRMQRGRDEAATYFNRGQAHHFLSNYDGAVTDYTAALERSEDDVATLIKRGQALQQMGNHGAAADDFSSALKLQPDSHLAYHGRAITSFEQGNVTSAANDIQRALELAPKRSRYHALAAQVAAKSGDTAAQVVSLTRAIAADSTDPSHFVHRAAAYEAAGRLDHAARDLTQALDLEPNQASVYQRRGQLAMKLNRYADAVDDFGHSLAINPLSLASWVARARAYAAGGQHQEGLICLTKAMHRFNRPQDLAQIVFARGKLFHAAGRVSPAAIDYSAAVDMLIDHTRERAMAIRARGIALAQLEQFDAAIEDFLLLKKNQWGNAAEIDAALAWLKNPAQTRPVAFEPPKTIIRPTRPPVGTEPEPHWLPGSSFELPPPNNQWVVQLEGDREFGPVRYDILLLWIREGRLTPQTRLLRSDWDRWRKLARVFPNVYQGRSTRFPGIRELPNE